MKKIFLLFLFSSMFFSCSFNGIENQSKGSLVVRNDSESDTTVIDSVYAKEQNDSGFSLVFTGEIKNQSSHFIQLEPGKYSIKIRVKETMGIFEKYTFYETGYNSYKELKRDGFLNTAFDGKGIYFK